jgi:hypothetical protein
LWAVLTSPTCERACGKFPTNRRPAGVVLLGKESEVVAQVEDPLEEPPRLTAAALKREVVGEPEGAGEEGRLSGRESIDFSVRRVAADGAVAP